MKYELTLILLSIAILVLIGNLFWGELFFPGDAAELRPSRFWTDLQVQDIQRIEINSPYSEYPVLLVKKSPTDRSQEQAGEPFSSEWNIEIQGEIFPANISRIEDLAERLESLNYYAVAGQTPENWRDFGVEPDRAPALHFSFKAGKRDTLTLYIGDGIEASRQEYIRIEGDDRTYIADEMSPYISTQQNYWSMLSLFPFDLSLREVYSYSLQEDGERKFFLEKIINTETSQEEWRLSGADAKGGNKQWVEPEVVESSLQNLFELRADAFAVSDGLSFDSAGGTFAAHRILTVEMMDGRSYELRIGNPYGQNQVFAGTYLSPYTYLVSEWKIASILNEVLSLSE